MYDAGDMGLGVWQEEVDCVFAHVIISMYDDGDMGRCLVGAG